MSIALAQPAVHSCYHKCLTLYFDRVFRKLTRTIGLKYEYAPMAGKVRGDVDFCLFPHAELDWNEVPLQFRGTHIIRDPRDLLISAYHYHLRTDEEWCAKPNPVHKKLPADVSYQQHLQSLDTEDGILYELNNVSGGIITKMGRWPYEDARVLELRFEDMVGHEREHFAKIFQWYGLPDEHMDTALEIAESLSLKKLPSNAEGLKHARKGSRFGQWREFFTPRITEVFKERHGETLIRLGYENDLNW